MRSYAIFLFALFAVVNPTLAVSGDDKTAGELLAKANAQFAKGKNQEALSLTNQVLQSAPKNLPAYFLRARIHEALDKHRQAIADYTKIITLSPKNAEAYNLRGMEQFKLGRIDASIKDFDHFLKLKPKARAQHWQRGISYYYARKFKEGKEQFEGYQTFDSNDVENAVWRYLCMVPLAGKKKARADLLKIGEDKRVPMRQIYDLFAGKLQPKDILAAAKSGKPTPKQLNSRLFYAHLYLGLYYESEGKPKKALEHLNIAADNHRIGHYMWDVAKVHRDILRKKGKK